MSFVSKRGKEQTFEQRVLSTLYNPFSLKNLDPKWPDGLCNFSKGVQLKQTTEVVGSELLIALFPGLSNWCVAFTYDELTDEVLYYLNHGDEKLALFDVPIQRKPDIAPGGVKNDNFNVINPITSEPGTDYQQALVNPVFDAWRPVSIGMRLLNNNSDFDNDGWFETVRTTRDGLVNRLGILVPFMPPLEDWGDYRHLLESHRVNRYEWNKIVWRYTNVLPMPSTAQEWFSARNWALMPSYASGKLKDLKDFLFTLNPEKKKNEFLPLRTVLINATHGVAKYTADFYQTINDNFYINVQVKNLSNNGYWTWNYGMLMGVIGQTTEHQDQLEPSVYGLPATFTRSPIDWQEFTDTVISRNFDIILVKIHGLATTRTVIQTAANYEFQVNDRYNNHHHVTNSYACTEALNRYLENKCMKNKLPFEEIRGGDRPGYNTSSN